MCYSSRSSTMHFMPSHQAIINCAHPISVRRPMHNTVASRALSTKHSRALAQRSNTGWEGGLGGHHRNLAQKCARKEAPERGSSALKTLAHFAAPSPAANANAHLLQIFLIWECLSWHFGERTTSAYACTHFIVLSYRNVGVVSLHSV